ncbi:hypothetical protein BDB00DRAFT_740439, partial [Zychaea mexicana]|uniref:uncharacterized protein n=1 Tax=Zychaea mexicana TaxID=64656 RepID=UPI0022FEEC78
IVSSDLALLWANNVFQHFNIFFPLLSRQHFLFQLVHRKHTMNPLLRYAVYALGCRYINPEDRTARLWFNKAQVLAEHETHVSLSIVQALAIMCWYTYLAGDLQQCSRLRHQLYRAVHDCDLGHEATNCSVVEQEMRRRGLWASY